MVIHTGGGRFEAIAANTTVSPQQDKAKLKPKKRARSCAVILKEMEKARESGQAKRVLSLFKEIQPRLNTVYGEGTTRNAQYRKQVIACYRWAREYNAELQRQRKKIERQLRQKKS